MATRAGVSIRPYSDSTKPHLRFVAAWHDGEQRRRRFFRTKKDAASFKNRKDVELLNLGIRAHALADDVKEQAARGVQALRPYGKSLQDAVQHYLRHLEATAASCTVAELFERLQEAKERAGRSEVYLGELRWLLGPFVEEHGTQPASTVTRTEVQAWLRSVKVGPVGLNKRAALLRLLFNFGIREGTVQENPAAFIEKIRTPNQPPGILTVAETRELLQKSPPELVPYFAIGAFCGLRSAELQRLDWAEVDLERGFVEVRAAKAKSARRRLADIPENLQAWLAPHARRAGPLYYSRRAFEHLQAELSFKWPSNALRHSFASYHLAAHQDAARTALLLGHSSTQRLFEHYREVVTKQDAERYFSIYPEGE